jgi:HlyD family secretion protein
MSRKRRRIWPWRLILCAAAGGGWWWWQEYQQEKPQVVEYETALVDTGDVIKAVRASGELNPLAKVEIGSQISGTISKLHVDHNSKVKAGDILCQLDPATYEASYAQAAAEKASADADLEYQKKTLDRKKQLLEQNLFPPAEFDKAIADQKGAESQLLLAEARLKKAKVDLDRCNIYAPIDGVIIDRTAELGQTIAASFNAPKLFILANDLTKMQINAKVSEADIGQVMAGQKVKFNVDAYPEEFTGEVVQVRNAPIEEENVVNYDAIIAVNNAELKLKPGMTAVVQIITGERPAVLRVPNAALRFKPDLPIGDMAHSNTKFERERRAAVLAELPKNDPSVKKVYAKAAAGSTQLIEKEVRVGITDGIHTEIFSGLTVGEEIILIAKPPTTGGPGSNPFGGGMGRR